MHIFVIYALKNDLGHLKIRMENEYLKKLSSFLVFNKDTSISVIEEYSLARIR